jgi:hypothetical protein
MGNWVTPKVEPDTVEKRKTSALSGIIYITDLHKQLLRSPEHVTWRLLQ